MRNPFRALVTLLITYLLGPRTLQATEGLPLSGRMRTNPSTPGCRCLRGILRFLKSTEFGVLGFKICDIQALRAEILSLNAPKP